MYCDDSLHDIIATYISLRLGSFSLEVKREIVVNHDSQ